MKAQFYNNQTCCTHCFFNSFTNNQPSIPTCPKYSTFNFCCEKTSSCSRVEGNKSSKYGGLFARSYSSKDPTYLSLTKQAKWIKFSTLNPTITWLWCLIFLNLTILAWTNCWILTLISVFCRSNCLSRIATKAKALSVSNSKVCFLAVS